MTPRLFAILLARLLAGLLALTGHLRVLANEVEEALPPTVTAPASIPSAPIPPAEMPEVQELVIEAPEPRYVAPTLRDRIGRVWAPVYINGEGPFRLVLDTGANSTAVIPSLASRINPAGQTRTVRLLGVTGSAVVPFINVDSIEIGELWLGSRHVAVVPDVFGGAEGVLGADGLHDKRIHIDFMNDEISIRRSRGPIRLNGATRVPVKVQYGHLLMFDVKLGGVRTKAMLDTGAQFTIGNNSLRTALAKRANEGMTNPIIGVTLDVQNGQTLFAPAVEIGTITIRGMRVTFGDIHIFDAWKMKEEPALLIGMDIIGLLDTLIIDYKRRELYMRPRGHLLSGT